MLLQVGLPSVPRREREAGAKEAFTVINSGLKDGNTDVDLGNEDSDADGVSIEICVCIWRDNAIPKELNARKWGLSKDGKCISESNCQMTSVRRQRGTCNVCQSSVRVSA